MSGWASQEQRCLRHRVEGVAVGIRLTPYPPHRSVRADFPHTALASGGDAQAARGIRMADMGGRKPALDEPFHPFPWDASLLASPSKDVMPEVAHPETEVGQGVPVSRHSKVSDMPAHNGLQPCSDFRDRVRWPDVAIREAWKRMVGARGFEPPTPWSRTRCATRLRYAPNFA